MKVTTDIDIDFADREKALAEIMHISATTSGHKKHPSGVYFQNIPTDPLTGWAALDHEAAADNGYFKIDFLNNSLYQGVRDDAHLVELVNREPPWELLEDRDIVGMLAHIHSAFGIVQSIRPKSVEDLAVVLALQRPAKSHLIRQPRAEIDASIWSHSGEEFAFKRAHAIAYAMSIVVQLNLLVENVA